MRLGSPSGALGVALALILVAAVSYAIGTESAGSETSTVTRSSISTTSTTLTEVSTSVLTSAWTDTTYLQKPGSGQLGPWNATTSFPFPPGVLTCVANGGLIYCVGGLNDSVRVEAQVAPNAVYFMNRTYYAPLSPNGVGPWTRTTDYPIQISRESCVVYAGFVYCVGGDTGTTGSVAKGTAAVYYAPLTPTGIGVWKQTRSYPYPVAPYCMEDSGNIFCVSGHFNGTIYTGKFDAFFAHLSSAGVGNWTQSHGLPSPIAGCSGSGGFAYCFGGAPCSPPGPPIVACPSPSYYSPLSPDGFGSWVETTGLPSPAFANFVAADSYEYYFLSPYYLASLTPDGIGSWTTSTPYPEGGPSSCVANGNYLYCVGGFNATLSASTNSVFYSLIH